MISRLFLLSWLFLLLFSCEEATDFPIPEVEQRIVVLSNFSSNEPLRVTVTRTEPLLSNDTSFVAIGNAEVGIYQEGVLLENLHFVQLPPPTGLFFQTADFQPAINTSYELRVRAPGLPMVTAVSSLPTPVALQQVELADIKRTTTFQGDRATFDYTLDVELQDPPQKTNQYHLLIRQQKLTIAEGDGRPTETSIEQPRILAVEMATVDIENYHRGGFLFTDNEHNGEALRFRFKLQTTTSNSSQQLGKLFVELRTTSEDYHLYNQSISDAFQSSGEPVDQPVIIYTNIENGYGVFGGYSVVRDSLKVEL